MVKVSVIIPIYGVEKYLCECLDSVINQTLKDIEIICIDDGGKDGCPQICDEYAKKDERIKVIHKENRGYGHSCNVGIDLARGEYIAIVEPDDFIDENMYLDMHDAALRNNADIVKSNYIENYDLKDKKFQRIMPDDKEFIKPKGVFTLKRYPVFMLIHPSIWSCLYRREFIQKNNIKFTEAPGAGWTDNLFQVMTMNLAERIFYLDKAYYYWRKVNIDDANDLKDITIPFKRSAEIHKWLEDENITDEEILSFLYKRELVYFHIINRIVKINELSRYFRMLREHRFNMSVVEHRLKPKEKRFIFILKHFPLLAVLSDKLKVIKKLLLRVKLFGEKKYVYFLGHYLLKSEGIKGSGVNVW